MLLLCFVFAACSQEDMTPSSCDEECAAPSRCIEKTGECLDDMDDEPMLDMKTLDEGSADMSTPNIGIIPCPVDHHVVEGSCQPCMSGTMRSSGDDPRDGETSCLAILCKKDEFVSGHECVPCVMGTTREAGDDASSENTSCSSILCMEDEYVQGGTCQPCAPGTTRPSGDNASQGETMCTPILCAENQRVLDNECADCSPGLTRAAGDDASGDDTSCTRWETPLFMSDTHTCARMQDRTLKCWGRNEGGQLGLGSLVPEEQLSPITVPGLVDVAEVSLGRRRSCVTVGAGAAKCWGLQRDDDWLGVQSEDRIVSEPSDVRDLTSGVTQLSTDPAGTWTCAILETGEVACWGDSFTGSTGMSDFSRWPHILPKVNTARDLYLKTFTTCALLTSGQTSCWGSNVGMYANGTSQSGTTPQESLYASSILQFDMGDMHVCALLDTRDVWCAGVNITHQVAPSEDSPLTSPVKVEGLGPVAQIAVGPSYSCARQVDGAVICWGGPHPQTPTQIQNISGTRDLQQGDDFVCALLDTKEVACWGRNAAGQLGDGTFVDSIDVATRVTGITSAVALNIAPNRACALLENGQIVCWGTNEYGVLGDGTTQNRATPFTLSL